MSADNPSSTPPPLLLPIAFQRRPGILGHPRQPTLRSDSVVPQCRAPQFRPWIHSTASPPPPPNSPTNIAAPPQPETYFAPSSPKPRPPCTQTPVQPWARLP